jgi:hypothetical protein
MPRNTHSAQQQTVGYWSLLWQNVIKIFFIDLTGAAVILFATSAFAMLLFAVAHSLWGLGFRTVAESLLILSTIYIAVIFVAAVKRHLVLGIAISPILSAAPDVNNPESAPVANV